VINQVRASAEHRLDAYKSNQQQQAAGKSFLWVDVFGVYPLDDYVASKVSVFYFPKAARLAPAQALRRAHQSAMNPE
jgi:hypothetical protein